MFSLNTTRQALHTIPKLARGFATPAASKSVKPPITLHGIDGRYATALYTAAVKSNALDNTENELKKVKSAIDKDPKISTFLYDPSLNRNEKKKRIQELLKGYGETTRNFFSLLAENERLNETTKIIDAFSSLMVAHRNEIPVTIVSAKEIDNKVLEKLTAALNKSKFVQPKQKLVISTRVNPSILGGLVVEFGDDKTIDLSVSSKISKLNKILTGNKALISYHEINRL
ncbi:14681_t:CDS:2 [Acaulospora morrowiae]|uniref:ATP synthase subunit 5, mitochondrial n=1 Tax=Acaulospora morrowiae TaxID=94023 RepID=A0A9N8VYV6_9GLOM|nr:14681_t:CDS:2 [Acaulospora morrowiae]